MIVYNSLENQNFEKLYGTFIKAFSDYRVPINVSAESLENNLKRRGYCPGASICACDGNEMVGFLLNSVRQWNGKTTAYDTGTGVVKRYRNQGISGSMFSKALQFLKDMNVRQYILEVIQSNAAAVHLYEKQGFKVVREFECFSIEKSLLRPLLRTDVRVFPISADDRLRLGDFWDFDPSWQNSTDSVRAVSDDFFFCGAEFDGKLAGYGIIDKKTGDIPQIAVDKKYRRNGTGSAIMAYLSVNTRAENINVVNVDSKCTSLKNFLLKHNFTPTVKQYEMILVLE